MSETVKEQKTVQIEDWSNEIESLQPWTLGNYDDGEIIEALRKQKEIIDEIKMMTRIGFDVIEKMSFFIEAKLYRRIGFENFKDWIKSFGGAPSTFYRYLAMYRYFTLKMEIPKSEYDFIDTTKLMTILPLTKYQLSVEKIKETIVEADELTLPDLKQVVNEKISLLEGIEPITSEPDVIQETTIMDLWSNGEGLEISGTYKLVKMDEKDREGIKFNEIPKISAFHIKKVVVYYLNDQLKYLSIDN